MRTKTMGAFVTSLCIKFEFLWIVDNCDSHLKLGIANFHWEHWELAWKFLSTMWYPLNIGLHSQKCFFHLAHLYKVMRVQLWNTIGNLKNDLKMHFEHDDNALGTWWEPIGNIKNPNLHPLPQRKKHIGPLDVAYRLVSSGCKEYVCHPFLPTWNLPTKVKIPIYLDATLFGTLVGLGFRV